MSGTQNIITLDNVKGFQLNPNGQVIGIILPNGNITPFGSGQILGTATNDNATPGNVGEVLLATQPSTSPISLTTNTVVNVTSLALTPGDWDVTGQVDFAPTSSTSIAFMQQGISQTSATFGLQDSYSSEANASTGTVTGAVVITNVGPTIRISLATTTTFYLVASATFSASTLTCYGTIRARRER